jgi:hypothetical protein
MEYGRTGLWNRGPQVLGPDWPLSKFLQGVFRYGVSTQLVWSRPNGPCLRHMVARARNGSLPAGVIGRRVAGSAFGRCHAPSQFSLAELL